MSVVQATCCWYKTVPTQKLRPNTNERELIVECSNRGDDWKALATTFGVNYKTAYTWIRSGTAEGAKRGGGKPKALTPAQVETMLTWLEEDTTLTLVQLKAKLQDEQMFVSTTTIANYLDGQMFTMKKIHWQPATMNSVRNKEQRKDYVTRLNNYIQQGRQVLWIDKTNFNLFCRRDCGRSRQGTRAVAPRPTSRGKNLQSYLLHIFML